MLEEAATPTLPRRVVLARDAADKAQSVPPVGVTVGVFIVIVACVNAGLLYIAPVVPPLRLVLVSAMLWVAAFPALLFRLKRTRQVPLFPAVNAFYFVYFGMPVFLDNVWVKFHRFEKPEVTVAVGVTLAGLVLMQIAFYSPIGKVADAMPQLKLHLDLRRLAWTFLALAAFGLCVSAWVLFARVPVSLRALGSATSRLPVIFLGGILILYLRGQATWLQQLIGALLYAIYVLVSLATGAMAHVLFAVVPMFFIYVAERGRVPWAAALLSVMLVVPFAQTKHEFRHEMRRAQLGPIERVSLFMRLTYERVTEGGQAFIEEAGQTSGQRLSYLGTFAYVIRHTPSRVPYMGGETYRVMLWSFLPRVLASGKPSQELGQLFGHRYGLLHPHDFETSFNCAQIMEMFMNFGSLGVLIGMALVGIYYRALCALLSHGNGGDGMLLIAATALSGLLNVESDASNVLVGAVHTAAFGFVVLAAIQFVAMRMMRAPAQADGG